MISETSKPDPADRLAYKLDEFLLAAGLSRTSFYTLPDADRPRTYRVGRRRYVSTESARAWIAAREAAASNDQG